MPLKALVWTISSRRKSGLNNADLMAVFVCYDAFGFATLQEGSHGEIKLIEYSLPFWMPLADGKMQWVVTERRHHSLNTIR